MTGLLLNGLGVVIRSQDGEVADRPQKTAMTEFARLATKNVENEFNDRLIMTTPCVTVHNCDKPALFVS